MRHRCELRPIVHKSGDRNNASNDCRLCTRFGRVKSAVSLLNVGQHFSQLIQSHFDFKLIYRFQKHVLRLFQRLPQRAVGGFAEIPAAGMFIMRPSGQQRYSDVRQRRTGQQAVMLPFQYMLSDQVLIA
ncbi:hypothetical protein D3C74_390590 [compost metagenome]